MAIGQIEFFRRFPTRHVHVQTIFPEAQESSFSLGAKRIRPEEFNPSAIELDTNKNAVAAVHRYRCVFSKSRPHTPISNVRQRSPQNIVTIDVHAVRKCNRKITLYPV